MVNLVLLFSAPEPRVSDAEKAQSLQKASDAAGVSDHPFSCGRTQVEEGSREVGLLSRVP